MRMIWVGVFAFSVSAVSFCKLSFGEWQNSLVFFAVVSYLVGVAVQLSVIDKDAYQSQVEKEVNEAIVLETLATQVGEFVAELLNDSNL